MTNADAKAYPQGEYGGDSLSKRELFAAMAMQGFISTGNYSPGSTICSPRSTIVKESVRMADALIKSLNESQPQ